MRIIYKILNDSIAYLGIHTFSNSDIKKYSKKKNLKTFLKRSFKSIDNLHINTLIIDVSRNGGGSEGNAGLLYSYFGDNYQKYNKVRVKHQKAILDNGIDDPIILKAYGFIERLFTTKKMDDGSLERTQLFGQGLMAYKSEPEYKFKGKTYVLISPVTYSGASEFSNMMYSQELATFVGEETGGSYQGNTSRFSRKLVLPQSKIEIEIPVIQFIMNAKPLLPFGRGVIPHYKIIPTYDTYINGGNAYLNFVLNDLIGVLD